MVARLHHAKLGPQSFYSGGAGCKQTRASGTCPALWEQGQTCWFWMLYKTNIVLSRWSLSCVSYIALSSVSLTPFTDAVYPINVPEPFLDAWLETGIDILGNLHWQFHISRTLAKQYVLNSIVRRPNWALNGGMVMLVVVFFENWALRWNLMSWIMLSVFCLYLLEQKLLYFWEKKYNWLWLWREWQCEVCIKHVMEYWVVVKYFNG